MTFKQTEQAKEACDELGKAIDHVGEAAIGLILAEREECALTIEMAARSLDEESPVKKALLLAAEMIRNRRKP